VEGRGTGSIPHIGSGKMNILVTGGLGFIGSNFIRYMLSSHKDVRVTNVDNLSYGSNPANLKDQESDKRYRLVKGDVTDAELMGVLVKDADAIVSFASETHVDRSISNPWPFFKSNVQGVLTILEAVRRCGKDVRVIHVSCYDEKTRALTLEGFKRFDQLKEGDKVLSLNPKTGEIEVKAIEKVIIQHYRGKMVHFKNRRIDLLVTPNHRMFILNARKKLVVEPAEKSSKRSFFYMPEGYWTGRNDEHIEVKGHGSVKTSDLMYILGIYIGDGFTAYQEKEIETKSGLTREKWLRIARNKDTGQFMKIEKETDYKSNSHSYRIFFDIPKSDKCCKKVEEALSNLGIKYHWHKGKAGEHIYFSSKAFFELFSQCGKGAHEKHIPRWALEYSPKYLKHLFQGLIDSDGSYNGGGWVFHTVSPKLVADFCELCVKLGLKPTIVPKKHRVSFIEGRKVEGEVYCISVSKTTKSISRKRVAQVDYDGIVWCVKVEDNRNLIVERNGKIDFCGNTDEVYGDIVEGSFNEDDRLKPSSPYAASKAAADMLCVAYHRTYGVDVIVTRCTNNFGPYQFPEKLIPKTIVRASLNLKVPVYGSGKNVRDWIFVLDHCEAVDRVLDCGRSGEIYNISSGNELTNLQVVERVLELMGKSRDLIEFVEDRPGHDVRYSLNSQKIRSQLGWRPKHSFDEALKYTIVWYMENEWWWKPLADERTLHPTPWTLRW